MITSLIAGAANGASPLSENQIEASVPSQVVLEEEVDIPAFQAVSPLKALEYPSAEAEVREYFKDIPVMIRIAKCESTYRHTDKAGKVIRGRVDKDDIGVMQINERFHGAEAKKMGIDIHTLNGNMAFAKYLYSKKGTSPWSASAPCWNK